MSLTELEAKDAIREVIDRFSNLEIDVPAQTSFFTEDTHVMVHMNGTLAMDIHGAAELEKQFSAFTGGVKASQHLNGQQVITLNGENEATDTHYCRATLLTNENDQDYITDNYIRYTDTLVKINGEWKIKVRDQYFLMTEKRAIKA
ncbi:MULTISPECIES: nuclear transport factor 2 family protein [Leuconostoc]|uniref:Nuclear transport factor 2 family protein n=1 Tax=Leuconostoc gelidum subsp. gelidum TaxID=1607839 RepID=A0ABS7V5F6_LEUGE|nr:MULTISPECIES: nuclear transport factor 2 family protein [Leuconostoc]MBS0941863.1 nuclear transport factor 2 family protein [Leuconostoc mesenteroides]MBS1008172.1 nuclear transport factor 2 family protein [Leuconostoc suionicum]MBZ5978309.1 nuclear transport factor 2 family protein [Leuconostoc gelidum subsp. gelidum]MBZ6000176.1 nuclear transport factor 2 family protein [Leuconostoc gelidum subsp. gelidum]